MKLDFTELIRAIRHCVGAECGECKVEQYLEECAHPSAKLMEQFAQGLDAMASKRCAEHSKKMTNGDMFRQLTDEEIAEHMTSQMRVFQCRDCSERGKLMCDRKCEAHCLEWLRKEAKEDLIWRG